MTVLLARQGSVGVVTFDRPGAKNAFTLKMRDELCDAFAALQKDAKVRAVVLTGANGDFCAGADTGEMGSTEPEEFIARMHMLHAMARSIFRFRAPVVAAVDGVCVGAAWGFALASDIVVASARARFIASFRRIGYAPDAGLAWHLLRQTNAMRAKEIVYSGREVSAAEALQLGLALDVVPPDDLMPRAMALASAMADGPATALHLAKLQFRAASSAGFEAFLDGELAHQPLLGQTADHRGAVQALREKRPPVFGDAVASDMKA